MPQQHAEHGDCCCRIDAHCPGQDRETSVDIRAQLREPAFDMTEPPLDRDEPTGLLTHHLIQDKATDDFLYRLLRLTRGHPAARWLDAAEIFVPGLPARGGEPCA